MSSETLPESQQDQNKPQPETRFALARERIAKTAGTLNQNITQHPQLSWGGGAGVIFLFGASAELSGVSIWKAGTISALCYLVALVMVGNVLYKANSSKKATGYLAISVLATIVLWYILLPAPTVPSPTAKDIAAEVIKGFPSTTPNIAITPTVSPSASTTPTQPGEVLTDKPSVQPSVNNSAPKRRQKRDLSSDDTEKILHGRKKGPKVD